MTQTTNAERIELASQYLNKKNTRPQNTSVEDHDVIYLQPWCQICKNGCEDRTWCKDDVWDKCEECGLKSVKYKRVK